MMQTLGPRLVVAGTASGVGKTSVATGLMAALRARGRKVAAAKVGPDFIDPGYHALATGGPPRNLDAWMCGTEAVAPLAARAGYGADILIIEGVMGLFDGADDGTPSSTADVARLLDAPVLLVLDATGQGGSIAATVRGFRDHTPRVRLAGVVCNRVGSERHATILRDAIEPLGIPVVGIVPRDDAVVWRDRHLGLVPAIEDPDSVRAALDRLSAHIAAHVDLDLVEMIAARAPATAVAEPPTPERQTACRIAVAGGRAFSFTYQDNLDALVAAGAEVVTFDPLQDSTLPGDVDGVIVGGGFPEVFALQLAENQALMADVATRVAAGVPIWAECGGLLWLSASLDGHKMAGVVPTRARMSDRLTLGYRVATTSTTSPIGPPGTVLRGHEHHRTICEPAGDALLLESPHSTRPEGFATPGILATYLHHHAGGDPRAMAAFAIAAGARRPFVRGHR